MLLDKIKEFDIPVVDEIEPFDSIEDLISYTRDLENAEGFVVAFEDGHRVKIKADQYVRLHRTLERITFDRNIVDLIINEEVDDVVPMLPQVQADRVRDFEVLFWEAFKATEERLMLAYLDAKTQYGDDRKLIALNFIPTLKHKSDSRFIFKMLDGYNIYDLMLDHVKNNISSNTKWDACAEWLGIG